MHNRFYTPSDRLSRRRLIAFLSGAAAATVLGPTHIAANQATPTVAPAAAPESPLPSSIAADASPEFRAVADVVVDAMRRYRVPGAALGILFGDREEHATFGVASVSTLTPITGDTLFQIGSLTKTHTTTAIWRLIDEGALALDAPVRTYIPDFALIDEQAAVDVTLAHLLDHSAGWYGDEGFDTGEEEDALARYVAERLPVLPQIFPLGELFSYNNSAFTVQGRLIELVTGTTYNAAMNNLLLGPLGLNDTIFDHTEVLRRPYADGHVALPINGRDVIAIQTPLWIPRSVGPAGGLWSTTRDVLRYARFHLAATAGAIAGAANIVSPESLLQMREPVVDVPGLPLSMGRNWFVQDIGGVRAFMHNGDTLGQHTQFVAVPQHDFAFILLTNGSGGGPVATEALAAAVASYPGLAALSGKLGITNATLAPSDVPVVDLPAETLAEYAGSYADPANILKLTVASNGLEVTAATIEEPGTWQAAIQAAPATGSASVTFLEKDMGVVNGAYRVPFVRDSSGGIGWIFTSALRLIPRADGS